MKKQSLYDKASEYCWREHATIDQTIILAYKAGYCAAQRDQKRKARRK